MPKFLSSKCFVCDYKTIIYCENVFALRSKHTETPIIDYLKRFAEHSQLASWSQFQNLEKTIICQLCLIKINEYDLACMMATDMENQLKVLLKRKEEWKEPDPDFCPGTVSSDSDNERDDVDESGIQVTVMKCNVCNISFQSFGELTKHSHVPKKIKGLVIKKIGKNGQTKIIDNFKSISSHKNMSSAKANTKTGKVKVRNVSCRQCGSLFYSKNDVKEHIKEVHNTCDENRCSICRGLYPDKEVLKNHMILHEGKNRLQCVECHTVFTRSNGLMRHMSIHTGEKFHICDTCGKEFIYQSSFRRHLLVHGNIRNYSCVVCEKSFVQTTHLKVHMRSHSKERPYKCPANGCDKTFTYRYTMLAHYKSHPGVAMDEVLIKKSHRCSLCHLSFSQRRKLDDHYVSAHDAIIDGSRSNVKDMAGFENHSTLQLNV